MSVVRLALLARKQEIEIMQLVGAPLAFIRGPFVAEGTLLGLAGAVLSLAALWMLYTTGRGPVTAWASGIVDTGDLHFLPPGLVVLVLLGGTVIGCLGGRARVEGRPMTPGSVDTSRGPALDWFRSPSQISTRGSACQAS